MNTSANDPVWDDYLLAVGDLARVPNLVGDRRQSAQAEEDAALHRARTALDAVLTRCQEWRTQAQRAVATGEARLVAAKLLLPDAAEAPTITAETPEPLVESLTILEQKLDNDLAKLEQARRYARQESLERAADAQRRAEMMRQLYTVGAAVAAIILFAILLGALL
ncbi:MAG TPA: hypothetical protein VGR21_06725 [Cryptosporangiaceae bacterium]|nr:hypothetical protein [Cryptosporangiaceae bacterium]